MNQRREFLKFLAASPLLTSYSAFAQEVEESLGERLTDPSEVINIFEMEAAARSKVPPAHFGYLVTGVDSDGTLRANRELAITMRSSGTPTIADIGASYVHDEGYRVPRGRLGRELL